jgi:hypothetical protein
VRACAVAASREISLGRPRFSHHLIGGSPSGFTRRSRDRIQGMRWQEVGPPGARRGRRAPAARGDESAVGLRPPTGVSPRSYLSTYRVSDLARPYKRLTSRRSRSYSTGESVIGGAGVKGTCPASPVRTTHPPGRPGRILRRGARDGSWMFWRSTYPDHRYVRERALVVGSVSRGHERSASKKRCKAGRD